MGPAAPKTAGYARTMELRAETDHLGQHVGEPVEPASAHLPDPTRSLDGRYCRLEPLDAERHGEQLWAAFTEDAAGSTWTYLGVGPFPDEPAFAAWLRGLQGAEDPFFYAILDAVSGQAIGVASFLRIDPGARSIEVGWITYSPRLRRSRVATDAMHCMMREAFALGYRRYEWKCNALNLPSIEAAHRLGFTFEGLFRQALVVKGRNRDTAWFAVIDRDWPRLDQAFQRWLHPDNFDADGRQRERLSDLTAPVVAARWPRLEVSVREH